MAKKKTVVKVPVTSQKCQTDIMKAVAKLSGVEKMEVDASKGTLTTVGEVDPVLIFKQLKKIGKTPEIVSVAPHQLKGETETCCTCSSCSLCCPYVVKPHSRERVSVVGPPKPKCPSWCSCSSCRPYAKYSPPYLPSLSKQCELVAVSYKPPYSDDIGQCSIL